jgi:hypothetical protein
LNAQICPDCTTAIVQGRDIETMTYAKHRSREYESRARGWVAKSADQKTIDIAGRARWLDEQIRTNPLFSIKVNGCRFCNGLEPEQLHGWPAAFRCVCGEFYVIDRWFADNVERVYRVIA